MLAVVALAFALGAAPARAQQDCPGPLPQLVCATPTDPAAIEAYEASWLHRTLAFQRRLGDRLPLVDAPWVGTHNSANSTSEDPTLSGSDSNQQLSLLDQLRLDVRSLEIDVHFVSGRAVVCHARSADELHFGCTTERTLAERLPELRDWLEANPREIVLLYIEDHLRGGYDETAKVLKDALGPFLYRPPAGGCAPMPLGLSRADIRAKGKQVLAISGCGEGSAWSSLVFDDAERAKHEGGPSDFEGYPHCDYAGRFQRFFEDSTALSYGVGGFKDDGGLTPEVTREMTRCGVDLFGFDQLLAGDGRLAALAWSWAPDEPARAGCAIQRADGWRSVRCASHRASACEARGGYFIRRKSRKWARAPRGCRRPLPRTGNDAARLQDAMDAAGVKSVWLRLRI